MVRAPVIHADDLILVERDVLIENRIETLGDEPLDIVEGNDDGQAQTHGSMNSEYSDRSNGASHR